MTMMRKYLMDVSTGYRNVQISNDLEVTTQSLLDQMEIPYEMVAHTLPHFSLQENLYASADRYPAVIMWLEGLNNAAISYQMFSQRVQQIRMIDNQLADLAVEWCRNVGEYCATLN